MGSARTVIGVGPVNLFTFVGTGGSGVTNMTTDNHLGTVQGVYSGVGSYHIRHTIGSTGYVGIFTAEHSSHANIVITARGTAGCTIAVSNASGAAINPSFIHGSLHDGGG